MAFILGQTVKGGKVKGFSAMGGIWLGAACHALVAAFGLSAILLTSASAFLVLKWVGAIYLVWLGIQALRSKGSSFLSSEVRAVITTRGGAGAYRIADDIDFAAIRADPKPLVGFSDITSLHLSLFDQCRVGGIHGCLSGSNATRSVKQLLMTSDPITLKRDPGAVSAPVEFPGSAQGQIIGGNLQMLATSTGVRIPPMRGAILFLEYHRAGLGTIDRYLTQLVRSGALDGIAGVALGSFECARDYVDRGWNVVDVLNDRLGQLGVPVLGGLCTGDCYRPGHPQHASL